MSSYLREMNPHVCCMVDVGLSHALGYCPQIQAQKNCLYLEVHASNAHVHHFLLIHLVLTLVALKQSHHMMSMYM
jgi:hypothetical protein